MEVPKIAFSCLTSGLTGVNGRYNIAMVDGGCINQLVTWQHHHYFG